MNLYRSTQWIQDLDYVISRFPDLTQLNGRSVMITGAAGLICSAVTDLLIRYNEAHGGSVTIYVAGRSLAKMRDRFGNKLDSPFLRFVQYDACSDENELDFSCDYIIHGAGNAYPGMIMKEPVETMLGNILGISNLLRFSKEKNARRLLYISSSEVYGAKENNHPFHEDEYGFVDILKARSSYSVAKRAAETLCASYSSEYGIDSVIVRPGHIYGPTASQGDNRVSSAWAFAAARGETIIMKSDGAQLRSYCYCLDCAYAILKILLCGNTMEAYNISNPDSVISIREMGELLARFSGGTLVREEVGEEERRGFNPMSNSSLNGKKLQELGWHGLFSAEEGFFHTVTILREIM